MNNEEFEIVWHNALDLEIEGKGWEDTYEPYDRLPKKAKDMVPENVWNLSRSAMGMSVHFCSNAYQIHVRWQLAQDVLDDANFNRCSFSGLDLYGYDNGTWRWVAATQNFEGHHPQICIADGLDGKEREYRLYLPVRNPVSSLEIGVPDMSKLSSTPIRKAPPIAVYGTSIVHGAYASHSGMAYPSILGRRVNREVINLGFAGNAFMDIEIADLLAELDAAAYILDPLPNMTLSSVNERAETFICRLRKLKPDTPIILIEDVPATNAWIKPALKEASEAKCSRYHDIVKALIAEGMTGISYVTGHDLFGGDNEASIDGVHPSDLGFMRMANKITPVLREALGK